VKISIVINCDTRSQNDSFGGSNLMGCVSEDFLTHGVANKIAFFNGFEKEIIVCVDEHLVLPIMVLDAIRHMSDVLLIRKHTSEVNFNDWNYHRALSLATGDIICHVDQDTACFTSNQDYVNELISHLNNHKFVSYPSHWTPKPVHDDSFGGKYWASTRFFLCKRESLKLDELAKCIEEPEWMYEKYGDSPRRCDWTEHFLAKINGNSVFYPPVELHKGAIFSWGTYKSGALAMLNNMQYEYVKQWILHNGGITYPCDVHVK
jgi:hypothetical protein